MTHQKTLEEMDRDVLYHRLEETCQAVYKASVMLLCADVMAKRLNQTDLQHLMSGIHLKLAGIHTLLYNEMVKYEEEQGT